MLTVQRYAGRTKSAECLQEAVQEVEQLLGVRPKRRVWLIRERRRQMQERIQRLEEVQERTREAEKRLWHRIDEARTEIQTFQGTVMHLEAEYQVQQRRASPHCKLTKARRKLISAQKREQRAWRDLRKKQRQADKRQHRLRVCENIPLGRVMCKERMERAELPG
jgi:chromosome segregation ATPase